jgi:membrane associated rhomboid family serine protease
MSFFLISILEFIGLVTAFAVAAWARRKFKSMWPKVLFFFVAVVAGNVVYFVLGVICAIWASADAHAIGVNGWEAFGATIVGAMAGLLSSLSDRFRTVRKSN